MHIATEPHDDREVLMSGESGMRIASSMPMSPAFRSDSLLMADTAAASILADAADSYVRFLLENRGKRFYLKPYGGNAGDALISMGTACLLSRLGIAATFDPRDADVILMPGGNPARWPTIHVRIWQRVWERFPDKEFVVGPSGFTTDESAWRKAILEDGTPVKALFARDRASYQALRSAGLPPHIELGLAHDPALHLRGSRWMEAHRQAATKAFVLISFRDDHETNVLTPRIARYVPGRWHRQLARVENRYRRRSKASSAAARADARFPMLVKDITKASLDLCVETVREAAEIHTDRLHLMLLGAMLGKTVFAYGTSYNKLEAVLDYSLADWADVRVAS
jgi:exopolysaccharide biosynthesis predicted pyruvyltransferase EpsI